MLEEITSLILPGRMQLWFWVEQRICTIHTGIPIVSTRKLTCIKQDVPYLGMCLGGQLLAKAFQAEVKKLPKYHIGFLEIHFSEEGKKDPLYQGFETYQLAFQWHADCFKLPEGAISLAHQSQGFNQAFRYGERAYGLQYHCELTEEVLDLWLHEPGMKKEFIDLYGHETYERTERDAVDLFPTYAQHATRMLKNFFKLSEVI